MGELRVDLGRVSDTAARMKMAVLWDVALCALVDVHFYQTAILCQFCFTPSFTRFVFHLHKHERNICRHQIVIAESCLHRLFVLLNTYN